MVEESSERLESEGAIDSFTGPDHETAWNKEVTFMMNSRGGYMCLEDSKDKKSLEESFAVQLE